MTRGQFWLAILAVFALGAAAWAMKQEVITVPSVYVGEMPNDLVLHIPLEFYVNGHDLDPSWDPLFFDYVNLTPQIARCLPSSTPTNGCSFHAVPGATGLAQVKIVYANGPTTFEKIVEVLVIPAGSVTLEVDEARYYPDLYDDFYEYPEAP